MNIRRQLIATAAISGALVLVVLLTLILNTRHVSHALARSEVAGDISSRGIAALRTVTFDYILLRNQRSLSQWRQAHAGLTTMLGTNLYDDSVKQPVIAELRNRNEYLAALFSKLATMYSSHGPAETSPLQAETEHRLVAQLLLTLDEMSSEVVQLTHLSHQHLAGAQQQANVVMIVSMTLLTLVIGTNLILVTRTILKPIDALHRGIEIIGAGNLGYKTNIALTNELGELSRAFDAMASRLAQSKADAESYAARLQQTVQELEAFSYSVSHDLRAPLRGIDGWSQALLEDYGEKLDETGRGYLAIVRSETQRMGHLIEDMLLLSRVTRGELKCTTVDVSALANVVARRLMDALPQRSIEFRIEPGLVANADPRLLEIALTNLLGNAVKFTGPKPAALIEVGSGEMWDPASTKLRKCFFVRDNGVGFDMDHASKMFSAFQRMHAATEFPGTGIGLATVQRIVHRHGGAIHAEGHVGLGATFSFTIGAQT